MDNKTRDEALRNAFQKVAATKVLNEIIEKQFKDNLKVCGFEIIRYREGKHNSINMNFAIQDEYDYKTIHDTIIRVGARLDYTVRRVDKVNIFTGKRGIKVYKAFMFGDCQNAVYSEDMYNRTTNSICQHIADSLYDYVIKFNKGRLPFVDGVKRVTIENFLDVATELNPTPLYFYKSRTVYSAVIDYLHKNILPRGEKYNVEFDGEIIGKEYHYRLTIILK